MCPNVACFVPGCENPVIGQCPGYKGNCGRFYCAAHSIEGLCSDCGQRKVEDETYEDYVETAERLRRELGNHWSGWVMMLWGSLLVFGGGSIAGALFSDGRDGWGFAALVAIAVLLVSSLIWYSRRRRKLQEVRLEEIRATKPGFPEFYKAWKKEKNKEALMTTLAVAGAVVVGTVAAAVAESVDRDRRVSEVEEGVRRAMR